MNQLIDRLAHLRGLPVLIGVVLILVAARVLFGVEVRGSDEFTGVARGARRRRPADLPLPHLRDARSRRRRPELFGNYRKAAGRCGAWVRSDRACERRRIGVSTSGKCV